MTSQCTGSTCLASSSLFHPGFNATKTIYRLAEETRAGTMMPSLRRAPCNTLVSRRQFILTQPLVLATMRCSFVNEDQALPRFHRVQSQGGEAARIGGREDAQSTWSCGIPKVLPKSRRKVISKKTTSTRVACLSTSQGSYLMPFVGSILPSHILSLLSVSNTGSACKLSRPAR